MNDFFSGKSVAITGHTGFKGGWLTLCSLLRSAHVSGCALEPETVPSLFNQLDLADRINHRIGNLCDSTTAQEFISESQPDLVFHLAAQALVRKSYRSTAETWETNVMCTVRLLEALRLARRPCTVVVITTDKVYKNYEWEHSYRENDTLGANDPYSASKAACELVVASYRSIFAQENLDIRIASARAGNVIGGGDWSEDRLVPDLMRGVSFGKPIEIRNLNSVRPWQHVLESVDGYLTLAEAISKNGAVASEYNFGPYSHETKTVEEVLKAVKKCWNDVSWVNKADVNSPREAGVLRLAIDKARLELDWKPVWDFDRAISETVAWYKAVHEGVDPCAIAEAQIAKYRADRSVAT